jgi:hypothetical protein
MLTNEEKAKVFGLYIGCSYRYYNKTAVIDGLVISDIEDNDHAGNPQLILTDLSDITDEDAIEVARILDTWLVEEMEHELVREKMGTIGEMITIRGASDHSRYVKFYMPMGHIFCSENENTGNPEAIDFLRSRSYHLPYKGINLYEAGIAIKKIA